MILKAHGIPCIDDDDFQNNELSDELLGHVPPSIICKSENSSRGDCSLTYSSNLDKLSVLSNSVL